MRETTVFETPERLNWLRNKQSEYLNDKCFKQKLIDILENHTTFEITLNNEYKVSSIVCVSKETPIESNKMIDRGVFFGKTNRYIKRGMEICGCHSNSAYLYHKNPKKYKIVTGYGLSEDFVWRCHSWLVEPLKNGQFKVVETTLPRIAYYGYILTDEEALEFVLDNE